MSLVRCSQTCLNVLTEVAGERLRQAAKWGEQDHPSVLHDVADADPVDRAAFYGVLPEQMAKDDCERRFAAGIGAYADIAVEEMSEVICAPDDVLRRAELVQVAAVAVAWIESIDRQAAARVLDRVSVKPPPTPAAAPHCDGCTQFEYDCIDCSDALNRVRAQAARETAFPPEVYA